MSTTLLIVGICGILLSVPLMGKRAESLGCALFFGGLVALVVGAVMRFA